MDNFLETQKKLIKKIEKIDEELNRFDSKITEEYEKEEKDAKIGYALLFLGIFGVIANLLNERGPLIDLFVGIGLFAIPIYLLMKFRGKEEKPSETYYKKNRISIEKLREEKEIIQDELDTLENNFENNTKK